MRHWVHQLRFALHPGINPTLSCVGVHSCLSHPTGINATLSCVGVHSCLSHPTGINATLSCARFYSQNVLYPTGITAAREYPGLPGVGHDESQLVHAAVAHHALHGARVAVRPPEPQRPRPLRHAAPHAHRRRRARAPPHRDLRYVLGLSYGVRPNPHRTRDVTRKLECFSFDVACEQCEHSQ